MYSPASSRVLFLAMVVISCTDRQHMNENDTVHLWQQILVRYPPDGSAKAFGEFARFVLRAARGAPNSFRFILHTPKGSDYSNFYGVLIRSQKNASAVQSVPHEGLRFISDCLPSVNLAV